MPTIIDFGGGGGISLDELDLTQVACFWNNTDNQSQAATKTYDYNLTAEKVYLLVVVSASTSSHSSSYSATSGSITSIFELYQGNGLRINILKPTTNATLRVSITATSSGARNSTGLYLGYFNE